MRSRDSSVRRDPAGSAPQSLQLAGCTPRIAMPSRRRTAGRAHSARQVGQAILRARHPPAIGGCNTRDERNEEHRQERPEQEEDHQSRLHYCHVVPPHVTHRHALSVPKAFSRSWSIFAGVGNSRERGATQPSFYLVIVAASGALPTQGRVDRAEEAARHGGEHAGRTKSARGSQYLPSTVRERIGHPMVVPVRVVLDEDEAAARLQILAEAGDDRRLIAAKWSAFAITIPSSGGRSSGRVKSAVWSSSAPAGNAAPSARA